MARWMACVMVFAVFAAGMRLPASAAETGTIIVHMDYGAQVSGGEVMLYSVADAVEGGYRLKEFCGGGVIRQEDAHSADLALWLAKRCTFGGISKEADEKNTVEFSGLSQGLYVVVQTRAPAGWGCAAPFLVSVPLNGQWEILARPKQGELDTASPKTGQHPAPLFAAMCLVLSGLGLYLCAENLRKK